MVTMPTVLVAIATVIRDMKEMPIVNADRFLKVGSVCC